MILVRTLKFFHLLCLSKIDREKVFADVLCNFFRPTIACRKFFFKITHPSPQELNGRPLTGSSSFFLFPTPPTFREPGTSHDNLSILNWKLLCDLNMTLLPLGGILPAFQYTFSARLVMITAVFEAL